MGTGPTHRTCVAAAITCVLLISPGIARAQAGDCPYADVAPTSENLALVEDALYCLIDNERLWRGYAPLHVDQRLEAAAARHSADMIRRDYFAHRDPSGRLPSDRLRAIGYLRRGSYFAAGENLGWGRGTRASARAVMTSWLLSPSHARVVTDRKYRDIGVAYVLGLPAVLTPTPGSAVVTAEFAAVRRVARIGRKRTAR